MSNYKSLDEAVLSNGHSVKIISVLLTVEHDEERMHHFKN